MAVTAVVAFHVGAPWAAGGFVGVDVFFVLSGYLITGGLLREHGRTGRIALGAFFSRRVVRLAPAAVVTVLATVVAARLVLPPLDRPALRLDGIASLVGVENLRLALTGTDYLAAHAESPFQQFWSLGVEEQFYVAWALVLVGVLAVPTLRRRLVLVTGILTVVSFAAMLVTAEVNGPWAFFAPQTRAWEFGAGALVAVTAGSRSASQSPGSRIRASASAAATAAGLVMVLVAVGLYDDGTAYPGLATLLPVAGTMLLVREPTVFADPVRWLLARRPLRWVGDRSYSIYLWHWPVLVLGTGTLGRALSVPERFAAVVATLLLAWGGHAVLEHRTHLIATRWQRAPIAIAASGFLVAGSLVPLTALPVLHGPESVSAPTAAAVLRGPWAPTSVPKNTTPTLASATSDLPEPYRAGCHADFAQVEASECRFGQGERRTVLFGDSHAAQWTTPLAAMAEREGGSLYTLTKSSCPSASVTVTAAELGRAYRECDAWRAAALDRVAELRPAVVIISNASNSYRADADADRWRTGLAATVQRLRATGASVVVIGDTPAWSAPPNRCLSANLSDVSACSAPAGDLVHADRAAADRDATVSAGGFFVDPVPWLCGRTCSPVLWNVLVYRDSNHLTDEMASTLTPRLGVALQDVGR